MCASGIALEGIPKRVGSGFEVLVATFRARTTKVHLPERIQDSAEGPHGSLSTHCRLLLLLAPSRALAAPSRGGSMLFKLVSGGPKSYAAFILSIAYITDKLVVILEKPYRLYINDKLWLLRSYFGIA